METMSKTDIFFAGVLTGVYALIITVAIMANM